MQDLKKNKRKMMNKKQTQMTSDIEVLDNFKEESVPCEVTRGCRPKQNTCNNDNDCGCNKPQKHDDCGCSKPQKHEHEHECDCHCYCECEPCNKKKECEPCDIESKTCFDNPCGPACCNPIIPQNFCVSNSVPYAIEANRIYDTMRFQIFTDATGNGGSPLYFETEVIEVNGPVIGGQVGVTIDKICINYEEIEIDTGCVSLEDYDIEPLQSRDGENCQYDFEYAVCGEKNKECCNKGKGTSVTYKQRGLTVELEDLVLELRGRCGCTEFVALAYPVSNSNKCKSGNVKFVFNTLSAPCCLPSSGKSIKLRQNYQTSLTVDCIGKSFLSCDCCDGERYYNLEIPNGIDLVLCLQETVSILIGEQIVVLGSPQAIEPRIVDTFSKVCDFTDCGSKPNNGSCGCNK